MSNAEDYKFMLKQQGFRPDLIEPISNLMVMAYESGYNESQQELTDLKAENSMLVDRVNNT